MKSFIEWVDTKGMWIRDVWDDEKKRMKGMGKMHLFPEQRRIMAEALAMNEEGQLKYETVLYSSIKKSGKTALGSAVGCWYAEEAQEGTEIFVIANTLEAGEGRLFRDIKYHFEQRIIDGTYSEAPRDTNFIKILQYRIELPGGTFIQVLGQSYKSIAGSRHSLTLWDELWGSCVTPDVPVLTSDLKWKPVGELQIGEKLIGFDAERDEGQKYRSWKYSTVTDTGRKNMPCMKVRLSDGNSYTATINHPWIARTPNHHNNEWLRTDQLRVGCKLMKVVRPWEEKLDYASGYIAGALDGEGSLSYEKNGGARLCFSQRKNVMMDEMESLYDSIGVTAYDTGKTIPHLAPSGWKTAADLIITRKSEIMEVLGSCRPKRLLPKFDVEKLGRMTAIDYVEVVSVSEVFEAEVVALSTSTETYITDGFCSHNTSELDRRVWDEMVPIPTVNNSLRFISTYAGFENESDLLWEMYLRGVGKDEHEQGKGTKIAGMEDIPIWTNGNLITYWNHDPIMPWQTPEYYESAMAAERPSAFLRLHMNQWVTSQESFMPVEWVDTAMKSYEASAELWFDHPFKYWPVTIAIDAGIIQDCTAMVVVGYDSKRSKVGVVAHTIWTPSEGQQIDLDSVEKRLLELYNKFTVSSIVYDPKHLMQMMYRLKNQGLPVKPFQQTVPSMTAASQLLFDLFKNRNLEMYPDDTLRRHIQMAVAETTSQGFRLVKGKVSKRHHIDAAIALAMACYDSVSNGGVDTSIPVQLASPFSDMTDYGPKDVTPYLPPQLRD